MCTLTWLDNEDGYTLLFNRDELKTRQRAISPRIYQAKNGTEFLAPIDTDGGGTWLAVNAHGVTICLLNDYRAPEPKIARENILSRGAVVTGLAGVSSNTEAEKALKALDLHNYRGFRLVVFAEEVHQWRWDTRQLSKLTALETRCPITSSSFDEVNVQKTRRAFYSSFGNMKNLEDLLSFHSSHIDDDLCKESGEPIAVSSVCMHRRYSQTVSQCQVNVGKKQVEIIYTDGAPCETRPNAAVVLGRIQSEKKVSALG